MDNLRSLMTQFAKFPGAEIGRETNEQPQNAPFTTDVKQVLDEHFPQLVWDAGYTAFLSTYGGAIIWNGSSKLVLDIPGPAHVSGNISWDDISVGFDDNFFPLCLLKLQDWQRYDFSLSLSDSRKRGIYVSNFDSDHNTISTWYCETFLDLLTKIVGRDDHFSEIDSEE